MQNYSHYLEELPVEIQSALDPLTGTWQHPLINQETLPHLIDHTLLKPTVSGAEIQDLCVQAKEYGFIAVCIHGIWAPLAKQFLLDTNVRLACVANFPLGSMDIPTQLVEIKNLSSQCDEIDFVLPFSLVKQKKYEELYSHLKQIRELAPKNVLKIILETAELSEEEKVKSSAVSVASGFDFLKTSTGFASAGASLEDVKLLRQIAGNKASVKASGGIRDWETLVSMVEAGANRIGCSSGVQIMQNKVSESGAY